MQPQLSTENNPLETSSLTDMILRQDEMLQLCALLQ